MKTCAIVAEYNPFHAGHAYHIEETRRRTGAESVVAIMSGSFVQRGEPAILDKWTRARCALAGGADLVLELPHRYACASAERFARGAMAILEGSGIIDGVSYGCESEDEAGIRALADLLAQEPPAFKDALKKALARGLSFPAARQHAAAACLGEARAALLGLPNAILAVEYHKALLQADSRIETLLVPRQGSGYAEASLSREGFPSALALRGALLRSSDPAALLSSLPGRPQGRPVDPARAFPLLQYALRRSSPAALREIEGMAEGLENKLYTAARSEAGFADFLAAVQSRRYPRTRLCRLLVACLLGQTRTETAAIDREGPYVRVLGVRRARTDLLSRLSERSRLPVVTQPRAGELGAGLGLDVRAGDIYALLADPPAPAGQDFTRGLIVFDG